MKTILALFATLTIVTSCSNSNPKYAGNLEKAKQFFALHEEENFDAQLAMISKDVEVELPMYGSSNAGYETLSVMIKGYHDAFDNIKYTPQVWLPGCAEDGTLDGSVRTYGTWTGTNIATGKALNLKSYHYVNFDDDGLVAGFGDFFDAGGMMDAVYPKNLVLVSLNVKDGKLDDVMSILNSEGGLPATRSYDGCISLEMTLNEDTNTLWVVSNWESNDKYAAYLKWRQTEDTVIGQMVPFLKGGAEGITIIQSNSKYMSF
jgi:quinol monooxygenase YgiN